MARALAREWDSCESAEGSWLDHKEEQRLQRGVSQTQVSTSSLLRFVVWLHCPLSLQSSICLFCIVLIQTFLYIIFSLGCTSHEPPGHVHSFVCFSFCLSSSSSLSLPLGPIPGYFPTRMCCPCWEDVRLLPPPTPSSSHTGCLTAPSTTCCMRALVSTLSLVTKSCHQLLWLSWVCGIRCRTSGLYTA